MNAVFSLAFLLVARREVASGVFGLARRIVRLNVFQITVGREHLNPSLPGRSRRLKAGHRQTFVSRR